MYMYFFFCLDTKEKDTKKKKSRLHFLATPLRNFRGQKELATLKQIAPYLRLTISPPNAPTPMPEGCAVKRCAI